LKKISAVRKALEEIPNSQINFSPENDFLGDQSGIQVDTVWNGESAAQDRDEATLAPDDSQGGNSNRNDNEGWSHQVPQPEPVFEFGAEIDDKRPLLRGEEGRQIKESILVKGTDGLAGYLSFHVNNAQWGIYIPTSGIAYLVENVLGGLPASFETKCRLAFHSLLSHELFHFATDYMVAQWEMIWNQAIWTNMRAQREKHGQRYLEREEKLANAYMLRRLRGAARATKIEGTILAMRCFVAQQPSGYCDGGKVRDYQWDSELRLLAYEYFLSVDEYLTSYRPLISEFPIEFSVLYPIGPRIDWRYCPIHLVHDEHRLEIPKFYLDLFTSVGKLEEPASFRRQLSQLPAEAQKRWDKFKRLSSTAITPGMRLKKWKPLGENAYAFRIDDNFRAHLRFHPTEQKWTALEIGDHADMGHG
jgi:hypothetical protein